MCAYKTKDAERKLNINGKPEFEKKDFADVKSGQIVVGIYAEGSVKTSLEQIS
jgi:hypothetical protein